MKGFGYLARHAGLAAIVLHLVACNPQESVTPVEPSFASIDGVATDPGTPPVEVLRWGPRSTVAGTAFNVQTDGNSGVAFELSRNAPAGDYVVMFDGRPLSGVVASGALVTATIPIDYLATPGTFQVIVQNISLDMRVMTDQFIVEAQ